MVGKKNLEVRPIAINKGEIVKRILYMNPDAEFIFCAGDDKVSSGHSAIKLHGDQLLIWRPTKTCSVRSFYSINLDSSNSNQNKDLLSSDSKHHYP